MSKSITLNFIKKINVVTMAEYYQYGLLALAKESYITY
jgi:hypothetical protein